MLGTNLPWPPLALVLKQPSTPSTSASPQSSPSLAAGVPSGHEKTGVPSTSLVLVSPGTAGIAAVPGIGLPPKAVALLAILKEDYPLLSLPSYDSVPLAFNVTLMSSSANPEDA